MSENKMKDGIFEIKAKVLCQFIEDETSGVEEVFDNFYYPSCSEVIELTRKMTEGVPIGRETVEVPKDIFKEYLEESNYLCEADSFFTKADRPDIVEFLKGD